MTSTVKANMTATERKPKTTRNNSTRDIYSISRCYTTKQQYVTSGCIRKEHDFYSCR